MPAHLRDVQNESLWRFLALTARATWCTNYLFACAADKGSFATGFRKWFQKSVSPTDWGDLRSVSLWVSDMSHKESARFDGKCHDFGSRGWSCGRADPTLNLRELVCHHRKLQRKREPQQLVQLVSLEKKQDFGLACEKSRVVAVDIQMFRAPSCQMHVWRRIQTALDSAGENSQNNIHREVHRPNTS